jgi:hypothetical protein
MALHPSVAAAREHLRARGFTKNGEKIDGRDVWAAGNSWPLPTTFAVVVVERPGVVWTHADTDRKALATHSRLTRARRQRTTG